MIRSKELLLPSLLILSALTANASQVDDIHEPEELKSFDRSVLEDARLRFAGLAKKYGYPSETHYVTTSDGYVLEVHRIPYGRACGLQNSTKIPVLLQHGLLGNSINWILMGPEKGLGYVLADECYDVWLGNSRGNRESTRHLTMTVKDSRYWEFSWHELGTRDLPAVVDYILHRTKQPSLHYVGHSQGTTQFFVFASLHPEYSRKIRSAHMLSPVALMKNVESPLAKIIVPFHKPIGVVSQLFGLNELLTTSSLLSALGSEICNERYPLLKDLCVNVLFLMCGFDPEQMNRTMIPAIMGHSPAGGSVRQVLHYAQAIRSGRFRHFDHGFLENIFKYGTSTPPDYPLDKIQIPTALYYSDNDWFANVNDVHDLGDMLPNVIGKFRVSWKLFNHLDFIWAIDVKELVYQKLISIMRRY